MRPCLTHDECQSYPCCQQATERERRDRFWTDRRWGIPTDDRATDPIAWLEGDTPDE
jgi:hypothetical protein